jgi:hypothetical protein
MASANIVVCGGGARFEADSTERTATVLEHGSICNPDSTTVYVNFNGGAVVASDAAGGSLPLKTGYTFAIPSECKTFTFKTASGSAFPFWISE